MLPNDRLVCAFIEPQAIGARFKTWLLHVTIVPWFRTSASSESITSGLSRAVTSIHPFEAVADGEVNLGPRKNRPARLLRQPTPFTQIEAKVRAYLHKRRSFLVDETTKQKHEFRPHVTVQAGSSLDSDATFWCDRLYIVEQRGEYKEVVSEVVLG
jgi:2'-5' RNA ligase